jgi:hypothetical protein
LYLDFGIALRCAQGGELIEPFRISSFDISRQWVVKKMKMPKRGIVGLVVVAGLLMTGAGISQGAVIENSLVVTDVTPVQFCVIWGTNEPASGWLDVFADREATIPLTQAVVKAESPAHPPAESIGVIKVKVVGLKPETEYFFCARTTLKTNGAVYVSPVNRVKTEKVSVIVHNDVLIQKVNIAETDPAPGVVVIASVDGASYPVSGWVGDGVPGQYAAIDTNNFYSSQTHSNLELLGGEVINLTVFGGSLGSIQIQDTIPQETDGMQQLSRAVSFESTGSSKSVSGQVSGGSGGGGGGCFISVLY